MTEKKTGGGKGKTPFQTPLEILDFLVAILYFTVGVELQAVIVFVL